jgi:hypothetical protein
MFRYLDAFWKGIWRRHHEGGKTRQNEKQLQSSDVILIEQWNPLPIPSLHNSSLLSNPQSHHHGIQIPLFIPPAPNRRAQATSLSRARPPTPHLRLWLHPSKMPGLFPIRRALRRPTPAQPFHLSAHKNTSYPAHARRAIEPRRHQPDPGSLSFETADEYTARDQRPECCRGK